MDTTLVASANNSFCIDLFKTIASGKGGENIFISPFSISVALGMIHLGAKNNTAKGISKSLNWPEDQEDEVHKQFQAYIAKLKSSDDKFTLSTANRIYIQQKYPILENFKGQTSTLYSAEPVSSDFAGAAEVERANINSWVADQTQNKIKDLIPEGVLGAFTRMVIVNAIYFKGKWDTEFKSRNTAARDFKLSPGETKSVPMMHSTMDFKFGTSDSLNCRAIELPYKGKDLSMVIFLPRDDFGLQQLLNDLTSEKLNALLDQFHTSEVELSLPKFKVTSSHDLVEPLCSLGMTDAFESAKADFSGVTGDQDLHVSAVLQKAFIEVNEEGTEAAAATEMVAVAVCNTIPIVFTADHPFLYFIRDNRANGLMLFMGVVTDPTIQ